jgi:hypothetical protein
MKKVIMISLLFVFILAGCTGQSNNEPEENNNILRQNRIPGFERPEEKQDFSGIVKTTTGNEVTILKIERPGDLREENIENDENSKENEPRSSSGFGRGMGSMGGQLNTGTVDANERIMMLKNMSTGEEKIIIPVGIKMLKNEDGTMVEATLEDVTRDKMLQIWIDKTITDRNIANFIIIN